MSKDSHLAITPNSSASQPRNYINGVLGVLDGAFGCMPSLPLHRSASSNQGRGPQKGISLLAAAAPPGRGRVCESDTRQMDLNGDFPAGADVISTGAGAGGRARAFRHALKRQRRTTLAPCGGGGDRANFQLQSISMTPDGRAGRTGRTRWRIRWELSADYG